VIAYPSAEKRVEKGQSCEGKTGCSGQRRVHSWMGTVEVAKAAKAARTGVAGKADDEARRRGDFQNG
jgi:hypothetical protein